MEHPWRPGGHNAFFKGNWLFNTWTDASSIIDCLVHANQYIAQCEVRHGIDAVGEVLDSWQREVVRIVRKIGQYFHAQRQTQVMNEGWTPFWHYTPLNTLFDQGLTSDGCMHVARLWRFPVKLESVDSEGKVTQAMECPYDKRH